MLTHGPSKGLPENCSLHTEKDVGVLSISLYVSLKGIKKVKKRKGRKCTSQYYEKSHIFIFCGIFPMLLRLPYQSSSPSSQLILLVLHVRALSLVKNNLAVLI